jgi:asparagine synthase (glutamine-hydrolysing)
MAHRGPDDEGFFESGKLALGMRRLSIIDLTGGHQPIFNEDRSVAVILNGEIYNYRELRHRLWDRGHTFTSCSDSEVIAHAYEEWGPDCVHYLQGMFAFAVVDGRYASADHDGTLFLARDRLGIKPLYYCQPNCESRIADCGLAVSENGETLSDSRSRLNDSLSGTQNSQSAIRNSKFLFASEVRTLLASGVVRRQISQSALRSFLLFGSVSEPETLVQGVFSLPPGHRMTIELGKTLSISRPEKYWSITQAASENGHDRKDIVGRVRELLEASVRRHLISDVPVGVFLSGGVDSTSLAALASREIAGVHTFTVAFQEREFSEAQIARETATRFGTTHRELTVTGDEVLQRLDAALGALDQPSIDGLNTFFVSEAATSAGLKVALSGLGGDEVFGGYRTFQRTPQLQRIALLGGMVPDSLRAAISAAVSGASENIAPGDAARKIAALWNEPDSLPDPYFFSRALFTPQQVSDLLSGATNGNGKSPWWDWLSQSAELARQLDTFTAVSCMEAQSYLVNTLLRDTDSMSMAHSLEVRVPFLDHELVEFVTQLPESAKVRKGVPKALLVSALSDLLPQQVVEQPKRGFTFPWSTWLKGPLRVSMEKGLSELSTSLDQLLDGGQVKKIWNSHLQGHTSWSRPWSLYVLNEWTKRHL